MGMRLLTIMIVAGLAMSACGSSGGGSAASSASPRGTAPAPKSAVVSAAKADIPGFSGAIDPPEAKVPHAFGRCLHSWYTKAGSATRVHVEYPGPATVSVDLTVTDASEPPPEAHASFTMAAGRNSHTVSFPAIPHAGFPQVTVTAGQKSQICDVPRH